MIRFFRLTVYHIYLYYCKEHGGNGKIAKIPIFIIFELIALCYLYSFYGFLHLSLNKEAIDEGPTVYIIISCIAALFVGTYLYKEDFSDFNRANNYDRKYFLYFFTIILIGACIFLIGANENRNRIFIKRGYSKEMIENGGVEPFDPKKTPISLEGKVKLWYYNNFERKDDVENIK